MLEVKIHVNTAYIEYLMGTGASDRLIKCSMAIRFRLSLLGLTSCMYIGLKDFSEEHAARVPRVDVPLKDRCQFTNLHRAKTQNIIA
jgi:hypothetical protein